MNKGWKSHVGVIIACCSLGACNASETSAVTPLPVRGVTLVGAGDIARCGSEANRAGSDATARLLDTIPGIVFTAGDNAYDSGTYVEYTSCFDTNWGRHKGRMRPAPGNHEYVTPGAAGYFQYFGDLAGPNNRGYYSYDLRTWHVLSLNSNVAANAGSAQYEWVRNDLAATGKKCVLAYWHHAVFSSGFEGSLPMMKSIFALLYAAGAEIVVNGHAHNYERFNPQDPEGILDPESGIREFVVGTGGVNHLGRDHVAPNSAFWDDSTYGVIRFTLSDSSYTWSYITTAGAVEDSGSGQCH